MVPQTRFFQAANGEDLAILAYIVFDRLTRVIDKWKDRQN